MCVTPIGMHAFCIAERLVSCNRPAMGPCEILSFNFTHSSLALTPVLSLPGTGPHKELVAARTVSTRASFATMTECAVVFNISIRF